MLVGLRYLFEKEIEKKDMRRDSKMKIWTNRQIDLQKKIRGALRLIFLFSFILLLNVYRHSDKNFTEKFAGKIRRRLPENVKNRKFTMPSRKNDSDFWLKFRNLSGAKVPMCTSYRANRRRCSRERAPRSLGKF